MINDIQLAAIRSRAIQEIATNQDVIDLLNYFDSCLTPSELACRIETVIEETLEPPRYNINEMVKTILQKLKKS